MGFKTRVLLIEKPDEERYYSVQIFNRAYDNWSTNRLFAFKDEADGYLSKEQAEIEAIKWAKELEKFGEKKETIVYESADTSPSKKD